MNILFDLPAKTASTSWPYYAAAASQGIAPRSSWAPPGQTPTAVQAAALGAGVPISVVTKTVGGTTYAVGPSNLLTVIGADTNGNPLSDTLQLSTAGGGDTVTTVHSYGSVLSVSIPAQPNGLGEFAFFNEQLLIYTTSLTNVLILQMQAGNPPIAVTSSSTITTIVDPRMMILSGKLTLTTQTLSGAWTVPFGVLVVGQDLFTGKMVSETVTFSTAGGGESHTTANTYQRVGEIVLPAQAGAGSPLSPPTLQIVGSSTPTFPIAAPAFVIDNMTQLHIFR